MRKREEESERKVRNCVRIHKVVGNKVGTWTLDLERSLKTFAFFSELISIAKFLNFEPLSTIQNMQFP